MLRELCDGRVCRTLFTKALIDCFTRKSPHKERTWIHGAGPAKRIHRDCICADANIVTITKERHLQTLCWRMIEGTWRSKGGKPLSSGSELTILYSHTSKHRLFPWSLYYVSRMISTRRDSYALMWRSYIIGINGRCVRSAGHCQINA